MDVYQNSFTEINKIVRLDVLLSSVKSLKFSHRTIEYMENSPMNREVTRKTIQIIECSKNMVTEIFYQ